MFVMNVKAFKAVTKTASCFGSRSSISCRKFSSVQELISDQTTSVPNPDQHAHASISGSIKNFRCAEQSPLDHTLADAGLFYTMPNDSWTKMTTSGLNIKGFPVRFQKLCDIFNEPCMMIRQPGLEVVSYLKNFNKNNAVNRYLIHGQTGCGKSMTLQYAVHYCISQGWLIMPFYYLWEYVKFLHPYRGDQVNELVASQHNESRVDQVEFASRWLEKFRIMNQSVLENIYTTKRYVWSKHEASKEGISLLALVEHGISRPRSAADVMGCLMREVRVQDHTTRPPVLVAVDCVNALFGPTKLKMQFGHLLNTDELTLTYNIKKLLANTWTNGAVVTAVDYIGAQYIWKVDVDENHPLGVLGNEGFDLLDPHIPINVPTLSKEEVYNFLAYFKDRKWLVGKSLSRKAEEEILLLTNKPYELVRLCGGLY